MGFKTKRAAWIPILTRSLSCKGNLTHRALICSPKKWGSWTRFLVSPLYLTDPPQASERQEDQEEPEWGLWDHYIRVNKMNLGPVPTSFKREVLPQPEKKNEIIAFCHFLWTFSTSNILSFFPNLELCPIISESIQYFSPSPSICFHRFAISSINLIMWLKDGHLLSWCPSHNTYWHFDRL